MLLLILSLPSALLDLFAFLTYPLYFVVMAVYHSVVVTLYLGWGWTFYSLIPLLAVACACAVPFVANPVHSLLALIFCFIAVSVVLIASGAEFLGYLFLIVYVGAIAILFLFVIMLLNVRQLTKSYSVDFRQHRNLLSASVAVAVATSIAKFLIELFSVVEGGLKGAKQAAIGSDANTANAIFESVNHRFSDILTFADLLYTQHAALFMLATLLLLSAMIGAIVLAANSSEQA